MEVVLGREGIVFNDFPNKPNEAQAGEEGSSRYLFHRTKFGRTEGQTIMPTGEQCPNAKTKDYQTRG